MPLIVADESERPELTEAQEEARKIHPRFARGELVRVAVGRNLAEAEMIKGMLLEQGIPSMLRRTAGFDVPDFLAAGPRDVMVPESGEAAARELLTAVEEPGQSSETEAGAEGDGGPGRRRSLEFRLAAAMLALLLAAGAIAGGAWALVR